MKPISFLQFCLPVVVGCAAISFGLPQASEAASASTPAFTTSTTSASGLPIPRFVGLRKDRVRARFGPSFDYPVAYEFSMKGLPLKVIGEDRDNIWRRVEDQRMWIHRSMLSANSHAVVQAPEAILRTGPGATNAARARLANGVFLKLETCEAGWCRVHAGEYRGWLPATSLWGADS